MNTDRLLLEEVYLNKVKPNMSANHTETQTQNIPDGAKAPVDDRSEQQETLEPKEEIKQKVRAGYLNKIDKQDLDKSEVTVTGFGVVTLGSLKKNVSDKLSDLSKRILDNEPNFVYTRVKEKYGFLMHAIKALVEVERDIEKLRRAGKMPGMLRRYKFNA